MLKEDGDPHFKIREENQTQQSPYQIVFVH